MANLNDYYFIKLDRFIFRSIWLLIYLILVALTVILLISLWNTFLNNPTITTLESTYHSVTLVPFPGVALCNINKISRKKAEEFSLYLASLTKTKPEEILEMIKFIGNLYDFTFNAEKKLEMLTFQDYLDENDINIFNLTKQLASPCDELLLKCKWKGQLINCSELFEMRLIYEGYCCTFNYKKFTPELLHRGITLEEFLPKPETGVYGIDAGLSVIIDNDLDDYFYTKISSVGILVQIFVPTDYPDKNSGSLLEVLAPTNSENFLKVDPTTIYSTKEVINYPVDKRNCLFDKERPTSFHGVYSQSDCYVDCRVQSIMDMCKCIPFIIPLSDQETVCTLADLPCLNTFQSKWNRLYPLNYNSKEHLRNERQNGLVCEDHCYPSCEGTNYLVDNEPTPFLTIAGKNDTIIHIFYESQYVNIFRQDVLYYWFEILSNFGGVFGIIIGFSIISFIELLLYVLQKFFQFIKNYIKQIIETEKKAEKKEKWKRHRKQPGIMYC